MRKGSGCNAQPMIIKPRYIHCACNVQEQEIIDGIGDDRIFTGSVLENTVRSSDQNDTHQESMLQHWPHILRSTMGKEKEGHGEGMLGGRRG